MAVRPMPVTYYSLCIWLLLVSSWSTAAVDGGIPTTLEGPFKPVTVPLDKRFRGQAVDLPESDRRVQRTVSGFEPEQISVSLSSKYDSVWISWITGMCIRAPCPIDYFHVESEKFYRSEN
ncbi:hypothetical protein CRG98_022061 [Punica granatum]|uniref:Purple acid phosphatase Fn3-like domain-containing protein n=1 Tax=Punica granatum TaxID=22663 RepID=A0A2I0JNW4_PUNGR|nr:hypothetical protein CRG98_022061 [Punica granatum]